MGVENAWKARIWLAAAVVLAGSVEAYAQELGEDTVVVRQTVATQYEQDLTAFRSLLEGAGETVSPIRSGDSLSAIFARLYGVSATTAPGTYDRLVSFVVEANALAGPDTVRAGQNLRLPEIPPIARARPNPLNPFNSAPKIALNARLSEALSGPSQPGLETTAGLLVTDQGRLGSPNTLVLRAVSTTEAEEIVEGDETALIDSSLIDVRFEDSGDGDSRNPQWLNDVAFLRGRLSEPTQQRPVMIVLDDAWPTDSEFILARDFFTRSLTEMRAHWRISDQPFSRELMNSTASAWIGPAPARVHSADIEDSLRPLTTLAPGGGPVRVIYLPMFARQRGAPEILESLIAFDLALQYRQTDHLNVTPADIVRTARQLARKAVERLERASGPDWRRTDVAVIQAVLAFCEHYSRQSRNACFVSMSWTVPGDWYRPRMPSDAYGAAIAAAGNEGAGDQSLYVLKRQFAMRSATPPGDVLAVINIDDAGQLTCNSTALGRYDTPVLAVAYSGQVDAARCGTSFATPRVAWLYAAREAFRAPPGDYAGWRRSLWREVTTAAGEANDQSYEHMRVNVRTFFESR